jgi:hypothetical protein
MPSATPISTTIVEAVAARRDVQPTHLSDPLYRVIDPDALDSLFNGDSKMDGVVKFSYCGYDVTVTADGDVTLGE